MDEPCYYVDDAFCNAYVERVPYFFFWNRWYWNAKFYGDEKHVNPYAVYDGYTDSEDEAVKCICDQYKVEKHR